MKSSLEESAVVDADLLRAALDALDLGIALVGPDGRIRHCNTAYADLLAAPPELLLGSSFCGAGSPCEALAEEIAGRDAAEAIALSGEAHDGTAVDVTVRPLTADSSMRLVLVRRGYARALRGRFLPADVVADVQTFLESLTGHRPDEAALAPAPLSIVVLAIEDVAEETVRRVAQVLVLEKRKSDIVAHSGEGRFLVLAPNTPGTRAALLAERFIRGVAALEIRLHGSSSEYRPHLDGTIAEAVERTASLVPSAPAV